MEQQIVLAERESMPACDWQGFEGLPCVASLQVEVPRFTVGDLLRLAPGSIVETECTAGSDLPLLLNNSLIAWTEFELVGEKLAVRVTELL